MGPTGLQHGPREGQGVGDHHVVVGQAMDQQKRPVGVPGGSPIRVA